MEGFILYVCLQGISPCIPEKEVRFDNYQDCQRWALDRKGFKLWVYHHEHYQHSKIPLIPGCGKPKKEVEA